MMKLLSSSLLLSLAWVLTAVTTTNAQQNQNQNNPQPQAVKNDKPAQGVVEGGGGDWSGASGGDVSWVGCNTQQEVASAEGPTCLGCLQKGCAFSFGQCLGDCLFITDGSCLQVGSANSPGSTAQEVCDIYDGKQKDIQVCEEQTSCESCTSAVLSDGVSMCAWWGDYCSIEICNEYGWCGDSACFGNDNGGGSDGSGGTDGTFGEDSLTDNIYNENNNMDPTTGNNNINMECPVPFDAPPSCAKCLEEGCAFAKGKCWVDCSQQDASCRDPALFPNKTGQEVCQLYAQQEADQTKCSQLTTCNKCTSTKLTIANDDTDSCTWFPAQENKATGVSSMAHCSAEHCDMDGCGQMQCSTATTTTTTATTTTTTASPPTANNNKPTKTPAPMAPTAPLVTGPPIPVTVVTRQGQEPTATNTNSTSTCPQDIPSDTPCLECMELGCGFGAGTCLQDCMFLADAACFSMADYSNVTAQDLCLAHDNNQADMATCQQQVGCDTCTSTLLSDGESTCTWFPEDDMPPYCSAQVCTWNGVCGETECSADSTTTSSNLTTAVDENNMECNVPFDTPPTCMECLEAGCVFAVGQCLSDCMVIADAGCWDMNLFPNNSTDEICQIYEDGQADLALCAAQSDCDSCTSTLMSDGVSGCAWWPARENGASSFCSAEVCNFMGDCGVETCVGASAGFAETVTTGAVPDDTQCGVVFSSPPSCTDCLEAGCVLTSGECLSYCAIQDVSCYDMKNYADNITTADVCQMFENDEDDAQLCAGLTECGACTSTTLSNGASTCSWHASEAGDFCSSEICGMMGDCGVTTCPADSDAHPCNGLPACEPCLNSRKECAWLGQGVGCQPSCDVATDVACYHPSTFPGMIGPEICAEAVLAGDAGNSTLFEEEETEAPTAGDGTTSTTASGVDESDVFDDGPAPAVSAASLSGRVLSVAVALLAFVSLM